jgi:hypothetical protein
MTDDASGIYLNGLIIVPLSVGGTAGNDGRG